MEKHDKAMYSLADILSVDLNVFAAPTIEAAYITGKPELYVVGAALGCTRN